MSRFLFISLPLRGHLDWGGMVATSPPLTLPEACCQPAGAQ